MKVLNQNNSIKHVRFSPDFRLARTAEGGEIDFTKSEAKAIAYMSGLPDKVVTRNQILDAVSEPGSEKNDRNVDFLINRIRRKLGDDAKNPRYIASRYGEGYIWLSDWSTLNPKDAQTCFLVGPVRGLVATNEVRRTVLDLAAHLVKNLQNNCSPNQHVMLDPDYSEAVYLGSTRPRYLIELTLMSDKNKFSCVVTAKTGSVGNLISVERFDLGDGKELGSQHLVKVENYVPDLVAKIWKSEATRGEDIPLPVAMNDVFNTEDMKDESWRDADKRLIALMKEHPNDPEIKLMYATHLHSKYVVLGPELFAKGTDSCPEDEEQIERLVLETLPFAEGRPDYSIMAAKLLYFLNSGYGNLAIELAEKAHENSTKVASSLAVVGQMRSFRGLFAEAYECLEQARKLAKKGSDFHIYVLVLQCQAMLATNDREGLKQVQRELYRSRPATMVFFEPILTDPDKPSIRAKAVIMMLSRKRARGILQHIFYISGRLFESAEHRENMMRTPVLLLRRRFGNEVLTDEMRESMPGLAR